MAVYGDSKINNNLNKFYYIIKIIVNYENINNLRKILLSQK